MATWCKARQDRWSWNITFGTPVSITIREADVPDMETKNGGGILSGRVEGEEKLSIRQNEKDQINQNTTL